MARLDFGGSSDAGRHGPDAGPVMYNAYQEPVQGGKHPAPIYADDGFTAYAAATDTSTLRGGIVLNNSIYGVFGTSLVKVSGGARSTLGTVTGDGKLIFAANDKTSYPQIAIVGADAERYVVENDVLSTLSDSDLPNPNSCAFLNRKIVYGLSDGRFFWSSVDAATTISSLDFAEAEGNPDGGVRVVNHLQELWVFGTESIEPWYDSGTTFTRRTGTVIPVGCIGAHTIAQLDKDLFWVGNDGVVYVAAGYGFEAISNHAIEKDILDTSDKSEIVAWTYKRGQSAFYVLRGPTWTWRLNRSTGQWTRRFSYGSSRWVAEHAFHVNNQWIVGSNATDALYQLSSTAYDEAGTTQVWRVRSAPVHAYPNQIAIDRLHCDFVTGVGLVSGSVHGTNPQVGLRWSDDGGVTWSRQRLKTLGAVGARKTRVVFDGLGVTGRSGRIFELEVSAPVVRCLMYADIEGDLIGT